MKYLILLFTFLITTSCSDDQEFPVIYKFDSYAVENPRAYIQEMDGPRLIPYDNKLLEAFENEIMMLRLQENILTSLIVRLENETMASIILTDPTSGQIFTETGTYERLVNPERIIIDDTTFSEWFVEGDCVSLPSWGAVSVAYFDTLRQVIAHLDYLSGVTSDTMYLNDRHSGRMGDTILVVDVLDRFCPD